MNAMALIAQSVEQPSFTRWTRVRSPVGVRYAFRVFSSGLLSNAKTFASNLQLGGAGGATKNVQFSLALIDNNLFRSAAICFFPLKGFEHVEGNCFLDIGIPARLAVSWRCPGGVRVPPLVVLV